MRPLISVTDRCQRTVIQASVFAVLFTNVPTNLTNVTQQENQINSFTHLGLHLSTHAEKENRYIQIRAASFVSIVLFFIHKLIFLRSSLFLQIVVYVDFLWFAFSIVCPNCRVRVKVLSATFNNFFSYIVAVRFIGG